MYMGRKRYDLQTKLDAEQLRKMGKTYTEIRTQFPIPKSTLSAWLGEKYAGIFDRGAQLEHLEHIRKISAKVIRGKKIERERVAVAKGKVVASNLHLKDVVILKALIAMMYWAEGSKHKQVHGLKFANTDPRFVLLYITLLRKCFPIDETRFRVSLHLHYYHEVGKATEFWSQLLNIPKTQFWKPYYKKRSRKKRFRKNSTGICFVYYPDNDSRNEILGVGYAIYDILSAFPPVV